VRRAHSSRLGSFASIPLRPLAELRVRLTLWYVLTFSAILLLLGAGLFVVIRRQISQQLSHSLESATTELVRAVRIRERENPHDPAAVADALDELNIPERSLFLLDTAGHAVRPTDDKEVEAWVRNAAQKAWHKGRIIAEQDAGNDRTMRLHAERFRRMNGRPLIAVAMADDVELENRYAALIAAFSVAAIVALLLVSLGGYILVRKSTAPIERSVAHMRRFMADAAHELRTPLAVVRSRAEVALQQRRSETEYVNALQGIERESQRLGGIVENLLLLSRADTGELPLHREPLFLDDIALDATHAANALAERKGVELSVTDFDEAPIVGDRTLVRQLVLILLDNGVKFTPAGGRVSVRVTHSGDRSQLEVTDTGAGIAPEHLPHVFERFFRGDPSRARGDGAGLGLAIARWIAEEHGAEITVASEQGKGTHVTVRFSAASNGGREAADEITA
jgi:signal transduction histidine kinase